MEHKLHDQLNPIEIKITDDTFTNKLKIYKRTTYKFTPVGLLFAAVIQNNTNQIFVTCRKLNKAKITLRKWKNIKHFMCNKPQQNK